MTTFTWLLLYLSARNCLAGLRTYCADRTKTGKLQGASPIAVGNFKWACGRICEDAEQIRPLYFRMGGAEAVEKKFDITIDSVYVAKWLAGFAENVEGTVTLKSGRHSVDAKSIMGIFTLDLSKPMSLEIEHWKEEYAKELESLFYSLQKKRGKQDKITKIKT